jgi:hypothetical protein
MNKPSLLKSVLVIAGTSVLATGCVVREVRYRDRPPPPAVVVQPAPAPEVVVSGAPPPPMEEVVPPQPDVTFVWIPGVWVWRGGWVWDGGRWGRPPHPGAVWVPHRYVYRNGRHVWVRGGWR